MSKVEPKTKIITLVQTPPKKNQYGFLFGSHTTYWILCCPNCGFVAELDHSVMLLDGAITISPSVECPKELGGCGWHEVIQGWTLRRG